MGDLYKINKALHQFLKPVGELTPDPRNPRKHKQLNLDAIKNSLDRFGQQKAIVLGAGDVVLAGNGTLEAAKALGWTHLAAVSFDNESDLEQAGFKVADNRSAELAEWEFQELAMLLKELDAGDFDISKLGWEEHELEPLLQAEWQPPPLDDDAQFEGSVKPVALSQAQRDIIERAVKKLRAARGDVKMAEGEAVAVICDQWSARG